MEGRVKRTLVCDDDNGSAFRCCNHTAFRRPLARADLGRKNVVLATEEFKFTFEAFELVNTGWFAFHQ